MTVLYIILGVAIALMALLMITIFVSMGPLLFLIGTIIALVVFAIILFGTAFVVYKLKNFIYGDIVYYDLGDFLEQIGEDIEQLYKNYLVRKQNKGR